MRPLPNTDPIDIIIPHTESTDWEHNELRYCLRSVEKHLTGYRKIYIVGHKPKFLTGIEHIKCPTEIGATKAHKILHKINLAIRDPRVSQQFLYISDDHFLLKKFSAPQFPYYYDMSLKDAVEVPRKSSIYQQMIANTYKEFPEGKHFNIHCPIVYDKTLFPQAIERVNWSKPHIIKSVYANAIKVKGLQMSECKIREGQDPRKAIEFRPFFSIGVRLNYRDISRLMEELYPEPSCFEEEKKVYLSK